MSDLLDRRQFLAKSAASVSVPILAHPLAAAAGQVRLSFDIIVVDERIGANEGLSRVARASGAQCLSIRGDLPRVWFDSLRGACLDRSTVIAGFTSDLDSEVMRAFARDVGYRQVGRLDISIDGETGRETVRRSMYSSLPSEFALASELENLVDLYLTSSPWQASRVAPGPTSDRHGPTQLAAWVIAPIRA